MLKKLIAASAALALFACSSDDDGGGGGTSSESQGGGASSSSGTVVLKKDTITVEVSGFSGMSQILRTYAYGFTKKAGEDEDLTQFWDSSCPLDTQNDPPGANCELDKTGAILQNKITSQYAPLHYVVDKVSLGWPNEAIELKSYKLSVEGDQAALGINAGAGANEGKSLAELEISNFNGILSFIYRYWGGAHEFRAVSATEDDFWSYKAEAKQDTVALTIPVGELVGMGSFAEGEDGTPGTPFDISKVAKFLWVIDYDADVSANNEGSLLVDYLETRVAREYEVVQ